MNLYEYLPHKYSYTCYLAYIYNLCPYDSTIFYDVLSVIDEKHEACSHCIRVYETEMTNPSMKMAMAESIK